jgi:hypothetical protein
MSWLDNKATGLKAYHSRSLFENSLIGKVGDGRHGAETIVAGNGVKEPDALDETKSTDSVTLRWCSRMGAGMEIASYVVGARGDALERVIFPLRTATSGP